MPSRLNLAESVVGSARSDGNIEKATRQPFVMFNFLLTGPKNIRVADDRKSK